MERKKLKLRAWYPFLDNDTDSDDDTRYKEEDVFTSLRLPYEELVTDHSDIEDLEGRISTCDLYQDLKEVDNEYLTQTYANLKRSYYLLKRQLRRVTRHLELVEDHVSFKKGQLAYRTKRLRTIGPHGTAGANLREHGTSDTGAAASTASGTAGHVPPSDTSGERTLDGDTNAGTGTTGQRYDCACGSDASDTGVDVADGGTQA